MASSGMEQLKEAFQSHAHQDDPSSDKTITLDRADNWLQQANLIGEKITKSDTAEAFRKYGKDKLDYESFVSYVDDLAKSKGVDASDMKTKLSEAASPIVSDMSKKLSATASNAQDQLNEAVKAAAAKYNK